ncbi:putative spx domain-containing protein [Phaeoacremonium minimum UCRPA7]|uniref:Putative spx domain-containing protein n=1 Tax=Phaeoacremonium minimum (strain UCR-PA7) TaxID=1286976 RepID=R8BM43_PHAM7|nr:putative spx domain-containing protein [Phaeoacremonium minimum UCRPA7]EOO00443.1 putative spx domain-containing protein [Phaeoacremonium minimum UCRPA7]
MKFSHSIQFNAVPDWSSHYIAYSNLKKLIYQLEKSVHQTVGTDAESRPLIQNEEPEAVFKRALDVELEKIDSFYHVKEKELTEEIDNLLRDVGAFENELTRSLRRFSTGYDDYAEQAVLFSSGIMLKKRIISLYVQLCELKSYVQLNRTGFRKVLKKFDKIVDRKYRQVYMEKYVDTAYPFQKDTIRNVEEYIEKVEKAYTEIVTDGDEVAAKKDLRSHLREHVVWERNTVWRDLIGIERRAEAASLGRVLMGRDGDPTKTRLQGDDEQFPSTKEITTPIGRFTCPTWLFSSGMFNLIIIIAVFLVLLLVPIMEKPEQQNCLAMLVFVSLLWATEAIPLFVTSLMIPFLCVVLNVVLSENPPYARLNSKAATTYIFAAMWTPVIMLLLGGFTLAAALSKCMIDKRIATFVLSKAGTKPRTVLIANMLVAAFASMLISNVAAPVLCFSIIEPMLRNLPAGSNMSKAVIMGIALASNVGGMLSPIASPQNVVAMGIMTPEPTWGQWFFIAIPVGLVSIVLIWLLLLATFHPGKGTTIVPIRPVKDRFTGIQCHQLESVFGDMGVIAIIPIVLFFGVGILTKEDFNNFPWTIIILAAGGLSLGKAVKSSGLLDTVAVAITHRVEGMSLYGVLVVFSCLILVIATFISHTVAALIILPLVFNVGKAMDQPHPNLLVMAGVLMCSAAMALPTSGFPNMTAIMKEDPAGQRYLQVKHFISRGVPSSLMTLLVVLAAAMLSAFTARPIIELKQRDKSKIETILAYGDRVFVGLNTGVLRVYRLNELPPPPAPSKPTNGTSTDDSAAAGSPPKDVAPASTDARSPSSSQPAVKPTDLLREVEKFSTRAIEQLAIIKEANALISLSNYAVSLHDWQTFEPIEAPLARTKNASCFAVTSNIVRDPATGIPEIISRLAVAVKRRLLLWSWHESELSPDVGEIVLAESIRSVTWASASKVVCGMNGGYIVVDVTTSEVEDVVAPGAIGGAAGGQGRFGAVSSAGMGYMGLGGYIPKPLAAKLADGQMLLAKDINTLFITDEVWKMDATDYDSQVEELVSSGKYDEAISILNMLEDALLKNKTETLRETKMQKAEVLFKQRKYRESMDLFNEDEVHAPPERVLKLFPRLIAGDLSGYTEEKDADSDHEQANGNTNGERTTKSAAEAIIEAASPSKAGGFTRMFLGHRKVDSDTASVTSSRKEADTDDAASIVGKTPEEGNVLEGKDLMSAVLELRGFLAGTRARLQRVIDPVTGRLKPRKTESGSTEEAFKSILTTSRDESEEQLEKELQDEFKLVDTCLFRAYMFSAPTLASSLFRIPNFCDPDVVNEKLLEHNRYNELVDFFYGKKLHRQALELLRKFGSGDKPDETAPSLYGPERTIGYLQNLPPEMVDLILEFSEWTLRSKPEMAMEIFLGDTENAETLPRDRVLKFLAGIDTALEVQYLDHIITELNETDPDFHNRLVELLIKQLKDGSKKESWEDQMERLVKFLKESRQYSLSRAFGLIPKDDPKFYEAQAVVLSNMGSDKQALEIYVFKMKDYAKAEE